jgi:hypothetical protein
MNSTDLKNRRAERIGQRMEFGSWTRRRPIGRDYAAAKDAEGGTS